MFFIERRYSLAILLQDKYFTKNNTDRSFKYYTIQEKSYMIHTFILNFKKYLALFRNY